MSLGSKLKAIRRMHGMTQSALADGIVTHGMLSRIEHDDATPSLGTLCALAERLAVSPGFLLDAGSDLLPALRAHAEKQIADAFTAGDDSGCLSVFASAGLAPDKSNAAVYARCAFRVGMRAFNCGDLPTARYWLTAAKEALPLAPVAPAEVTDTRIALILLLSDHIDNPTEILPSLSDKPDFGFQPSLFFYVLGKTEIRDFDTVHSVLTLELLESPYAAYIRAQMNLVNCKFIDAILELRTVAALEDVPCFLALLAAAAVETCCKTCEDYRGAYESRERREAIAAAIIR